ncbi:unnamed protein product [Parnassius apollo]|uniref:(apollo) hypothetical protein n=1 Tax=Parnassius apollo TaxID=110799 RepID=A0A8S3WS36_PARAO|nr:unnamed protein product [Parnassius apollo]
MRASHYRYHLRVEKTNEHVIAQVLRSGAAAAGVLAQAITHARQTSLVTSWPARRNYKTGRAAVLGAPASGAVAQRSDERAAARPRRATGASRTVGGVTTLLWRNWAQRGAGAGT